MEFLRFVFSSFWVWLGFVILVDVLGSSVVKLAKACKSKRKITGYRIGERTHFEIENASSEDVNQITVPMTSIPLEGWKAENE